MLFRSIINLGPNSYRRYLLHNVSYRSDLYNCNTIGGYSCLQHRRNNSVFKSYHDNHSYYSTIFSPFKRYCSKGLLDGVFRELQKETDEKETNATTKLFPTPRVTLHNLSTMVPDKVYDVHYKQNVITPKGVRKKAAQVNYWTCTYALEWPEKMKFESTAITKKQAAEKAASQAVHWLYTINRIDVKGCPVYNKNILDEIRSTLNEPMTVNLGENCAVRIDRMWNDYENEIKNIYMETHKDALKKTYSAPVVLTKDSTIDEDDGCSEEHNEDCNEDIILDPKTQHVHPVYGRHVLPSSEQELKRKPNLLQRSFQRFHEQSTSLPIDEYTTEIISTLEQHRVVTIVGAAGCGKSTRAPAAILENGGVEVRAIVSEPRRVAAIGLAERVANELEEEVGESIGYQVRLRSKPPRPPGGSILYCTSGVLLRRLQTNPGLEGCTHVFIDEAHERDVNTDITLLLLKRALNINPQLKIIIMSATLDAEVFKKYFDNCPVINVPGRTFPVTVTYLEDLHKKLGVINLTNTLKASENEGKPYIYCDEVVNVIKAADKNEPEGAILVFLPGWAEIKAVLKKLNEDLSSSGTHLILPVHSKLSTEDQNRMFSRTPPGVRKILISTNIAETSITIPDVVCVIDSGAQKENRIQEDTGATSLETWWVSAAAAEQRAGRAGRVREGTCYRLYSRERAGALPPYQVPEILRVPLDQTVLDCKTYAPDDKVADFLSQLPNPPSQRAIDLAVDDLIDLGALTRSEKLTLLGRYMAALPLPPRLSRGLINASAMGATVSVANITTHIAERKPLFKDNEINNTEIREFKSKYSASSDHMALHRIQEAFEEILTKKGWSGVEKWCQNNKLIKERLRYVASLSSLYLEQLFKCGLIESDPDLEQLNRHSETEPMCIAALLSGCNTLIVTKRQMKTKGKLTTVKNAYTSTGDKVHISTESVNYAICKRSTSTPDILVHMGGYHSAERRALLVNHTSKVSVIAALLFCQGKLNLVSMPDEASTSIIYLPRHRLRVQVSTEDGELIMKTKEMIWATFQYYYERDTKTVDDTYILADRYRIRLFKAVAKMLMESEEEISDTIKVVNDATM